MRRAQIHLRRALPAFLIGFAIVASLALAGCGSARKTSDATSYIIPAFSGTTYEGRTVSLDTYRGKPLVLIFWASW
jgi:cytochrome oxidase Cu insertion factor (SCO1/SenC/PrrC family)